VNAGPDINYKKAGKIKKAGEMYDSPA